MFDVQKFIDGMHDYIGRALTPLAQRIKTLEELPRPDAGEKGEQGIPGADGSDGAPGIDGKDAPPITAEQLVEALKSMPEVLDAAVKSYLAENPPLAGKDGRDGIDAMPITDEQISKSVASHLALNPPSAGRDGRDGLPGIKGADGIGKDGANGKDGLGFDDMSVEDDGDGTATIKFTRGDVVKEFPIRLPRFADKGMFKEGTGYRKGDGVTWGGHYWIAQKDTPTTLPGGEIGIKEEDRGWRMAVKRGRDGKAGIDGKDFTPPKPVKLG